MYKHIIKSHKFIIIIDNRLPTYKTTYLKKKKKC